MSRLLSIAKNLPLDQILFTLFAGLLVFFSFVGIAADMLYLLLVPAVILTGYWLIVDTKKVFWLLLFMIPLSVEVSLGSLGTDVPTEPLMIILTGVAFLWLLKNFSTVGSKFLMHPLTVLVVLHIGWAFATTIAAENFIVSLKWSLAKLWYIVSFFFLVGLFFKEKADYRKYIWLITIPLGLALLQFIVRFGALSFAFDRVNSVTWPFFRNHVNYAAILTVFIPFVFFARNWYPKFSFKRNFLLFITLFFLLGIYLSYTRTAYGCLVIGIGAYFIMRLKLIRHAIVLSLLIGLAGVFHLSTDRSYLDYAPTFEKAVTHTDFGNLLTATSKGEDISTMERVYRWVGGVFMFRENPVMGFGPGNFYNFYRDHALNAFKTYVSNNPDRSSIHCYYLLMLCEQGLPGMLIFLGIVFYGFIIGERIYHRSNDPFYKNLAMAIVVSQIIICTFLLINDMMETDKVGSFFFISTALLVRLDLKTKSQKEAKVISLLK